jgi:predicted amidohydrolase YtcJ
VNARVRADPWSAAAAAVAFARGQVLAVGSADAARARAGRHARVVDCGGATVLPGLIDPHVHLFAMAAHDLHLDLGPVYTAAEVVAAVARRAASLPDGRWVRGEGLDEHALDRLPTPAELDAAAPRNPVRLRHRSRHASLLSGVATRHLAGRGFVAAAVGGVVSGHESGLSRLIGRWPARALAAGLERVGRELMTVGVTTVADATPRARSGWEPLARSMAAGRFPQRVFAMRPVGAARWAARGRLLPGPVKIVVEEGPDGMRPDPVELAALVARAARAGNAVAVHCVGAATLVAALAAFAALPRALRRAPHRLEHLGECPAALVREIARVGLTVVTNPAFVYWRGDVYRGETPVARRGWLYRAHTLAAAGVPLAAASDAPIAPADPWRIIAAARSRRTRSGHTLGQGERLAAHAALALVTTGAAASLGTARIGRLVPGTAGDAVVVREDPLRADPETVAATRPLFTVVAGRIAWPG